MPDKELAVVIIKEIEKLEKKAKKITLIGQVFLKSKTSQVCLNIPRNMIKRIF